VRSAKHTVGLEFGHLDERGELLAARGAMQFTHARA
jgi:hypothetical protein